MNKDPYELNNLAKDPKYKEKLLELRTKCQTWVTSFDDTGLIPEPALKEKLRPNGKELKVAYPTIRMQNNVATLNCKTKGVTIGFKINNESRNADGWQIYTKPVQLQKGDTLRVVGERIGYRYNEINYEVIN